MIILEILLHPIPTKYKELSQSLDAILNDLQQLCANLTIKKQEQTISFISNFNTESDFIQMLKSNEISVLSGAISMLTENNSHIITYNGEQKYWRDISEIRQSYFKP
jgi:hypothetical protein